MLEFDGYTPQILGNMPHCIQCVSILGAAWVVTVNTVVFPGN